MYNKTIMYKLINISKKYIYKLKWNQIEIAFFKSPSWQISPSGLSAGAQLKTSKCMGRKE